MCSQFDFEVARKLKKSFIEMKTMMLIVVRMAFATHQINFKNSPRQHKHTTNQLNEKEWAIVIDSFHEPTTKNHVFV